MNFESWYRKAAEDGGMNAAHMKCYHRHGFNPETDFCKYVAGSGRQSQSKIEPFTNNNEDTLYYVKKFDSLSYEEAKRYIEEVNGAEMLTAEEFKKKNLAEEGFLPDFIDFCNTEVKPTEEGNHKILCRMAATVLRDLNKRLGYNPRVDYFVTANLRAEIGGATTPDHVNCDRNAIFLNANTINVKETKGNWGHNDERLPFEIIAHEIGHALTDDAALLDYSSRIIEPLKDKWKSKPIRDIIRDEFSTIALTSRYELIADVFARITSPSYQEGELPVECEDFVFNEMNWR